MSSSLSIETIRNYSRKVKHYGYETTRDAKWTSLPSPQQHGKWMWSAVLRNKRSLNFTPRTDGRLVAYAQAQAPKVTQLDEDDARMPLSTPPWKALKTVFPNSSDFLCDALHAHLVAYNYLIPLYRSVPPVAPRPPPTPSMSSAAVESDSTEVPKKAASLLGMGETASQPTRGRRLSRASRKTSFLRQRSRDSTDGSTRALPSGREAMPRPSISSCTTTSEIANKELLTGLARCIARLVTTLRAGTHEPMAVPSTVNEKMEMDVFLFRSLCEIVRRAEEEVIMTR
jgi:hypothetical protein